MRPKSISRLSTILIAFAASAHAADRTWDGAINNNWNTTDANWTGPTWTAGDNAIFNTTTGAITLTEAISAGSFTFGLPNANLTGSFSGSALSISGDLLALADGNNSAGGPTVSFSNNVTVTGDLRIARRIVEFNAGNVTVNRVLSAGSWGRLLVKGATFTATNGIDDSLFGGNTMSVVLEGGSLYTPYIKTTTAGFTGIPDDGVTLNGGTLYPTANSTDFIQSYQEPFNWGTRNNMGVGTNGANFDTNGFDITITKTMQDFGGPGVLTKAGTGTLTLTAANTFTGGTTVNNGTLVLDGGAGGTSRVRGQLTVNPGTTVSLINDDGTGLGFNPGAKVTGLTINGGTVTTAGTMHVWDLSGGINMTGGTLASNNGTSNANGPQLEWINANVTTNASPDTATIGGRIRMRADGGAPGITFNVADGAAATDLLVSAAITEASGGRSITKTGMGTMALSGANNYTGTTTVSEGTLSLSSPTLDDVAAVVIGFDGKMDLNFTGSDTVGSLEIAGSGPLPAGVYDSNHETYGSYFTNTGGGSLVVAGANGSWTSLANGIWSNAANWSGNTVATGYDATATFNAGTGVTVNVDSNRKIGNLAFDVSDYILSGTGTLTLEAAATPTVSVASGRSATINANLAGNLGLEKTGEGTLVLTGAKSFTGGTAVTGGTLELSGATGGTAQIHGFLFIGSDATVTFTGGDGTGFGFFNNPVTSITVDGGTIDAVSGSHLGFGPAATLSLDNGATLHGNWQWNGDSLLGFSSFGDLTNTIGDSTDPLGPGTVTLRSDAGVNHTFTVNDGLAATDLQIDADLTDQFPTPAPWLPASGLTKAGTGTMVLNGTNTYDGDTVVSDGALNVSATASLRFHPTTNSATNSVYSTGTGSLSFLGTVDLDLSAANTADGNVWNLFDLASFAAPPDLSATASVGNLGGFTEGPAGTWKLAVTGAEWVFTESDGNLKYVVTATDYDNWVTDNGVTGGPNDDDDSDGLTNFEEYAFGLDPTGGSEVNPITAQLDKTTGTFTYTRRTQSLTGLDYTVRSSTTLAANDWTDLVLNTNYTESVSTSGEIETVTVTLTPAPTATKLFIQVRAD